MRRQSRQTRRGFSLLEVVLASVLLSLVAASVVGTITFINKAEEGRRHRLVAFEVANRLLLMYLDDEKAITQSPEINPNLVIRQDGYDFRWTIAYEPVTVEGEFVADSGFSNGVRMLRLSVYGSKDDGVPTDRIAEVTRLYHTLHQSLTESKLSSRQRTMNDAAMRALNMAREGGGPPPSGGGRR